MDASELASFGSDAHSASAIGKTTVRAAGSGFRLRNRLLAGLPGDVLSRLVPHLKPVSLPEGRVLYEVDQPLTRVYFVETGLVSLVAVFGDRTTAEMAAVGREGLVGIGTLWGAERALGRYVVPVRGLALAVEAAHFRRMLRQSREFCATCGAYAEAFLREALQTAACNSVHTVEERCARRLLMNHDRSDGNTLTLTQRHLAEMLGVCRSTVTLAAGALQQAGLIRYCRGAITVLDRPGLETASCECYCVIRNHYDRLFSRTRERYLSEPPLSLPYQLSRARVIR